MSDSPSAPHPAAVGTRGGAAGVASLVIAVLLVAGGLAVQVFGLAFPLLRSSFGVDLSAISLFFAVATFVTIVVALVGLALGLVGIQPHRTRGRLAAAAGIAIAVSFLLSSIVGLVAPFSLTAFS